MWLEDGYVQRECIDGCIAAIRDRSLEGEVHRYRMLTADLVMLNTRIQELEQVWGTMDAARLGCIRRLEMADTLTRIQDVEERTIGGVLGGFRSYAAAVRRGLRT